VLNENWCAVEKEMVEISNICKNGNIVSKCIIETSTMKKRSWLERLFFTVRDTGVDFIKTSTGFSGEGAQIEHVKFWNSLRDKKVGPLIKASGGIKTAAQALSFIEAGADRLGLSASVEVLEQYERKEIL
jgi:deoxyribose-phosphate aldolase